MALVIYTASGLIRRIIFDELCSDAVLVKRFPVLDDEFSLCITAEFTNLGDFDAARFQDHVSKVTGLVPGENDR